MVEEPLKTTVYTDYEEYSKYYYVPIPCGDGRFMMVSINNEGNLILQSEKYDSIEDVEKATKIANMKITQDMINYSRVSWAWRFAKRMED